MDIVIRPMAETDEKEVRALAEPVYAEQPGSFSLTSKLKSGQVLGACTAVVQPENEVVGYGVILAQPRFKGTIVRIELTVAPRYRNQGTGRLLYCTMMETLEPTRPQIIEARVFVEQSAALSFLLRRGFAENHRMVKARLSLTDTDRNPGTERANRPALEQIEIVTFKDEMDVDPDCLAKLQRLWSQTWPDYPNEHPAYPPSPPDDDRLLHNDNIPEAFFIAKYKDIYVGISHLMKNDADPGYLMQGNTAVLGAFRNKGIATALKSCVIRYAKSKGYQGIFTCYRNTNIPMAKVNKKLGWKAYSEEIRLEKRCGTQA